MGGETGAGVGTTSGAGVSETRPDVGEPFVLVGSSDSFVGAIAIYHSTLFSRGVGGVRQRTKERLVEGSSSQAIFSTFLLHHYLSSHIVLYPTSRFIVAFIVSTFEFIAKEGMRWTTCWNYCSLPPNRR